MIPHCEIHHKALVRTYIMKDGRKVGVGWYCDLCSLKRVQCPHCRKKFEV